MNEKSVEKNLFFKNISACPLCKSQGYVDKFSLKQLIWYTKVRMCKNCGILYKSTQPNNKLLEFIYSTSYVHFNIEEKKDIYTSRVKRLGEPKHKRNRHLDYGCGAGGFVSSALNAGWDSYGCDPFLPDDVNPSLLKRMHKLDIENEDTIEKLGTYDVISMWAVAEHLTEPLVTFKALCKLLNPGGRLIFNWPNGNSFAAMKQGEKWGMAILLEHLTFITPKSITWLAEILEVSVEKMSFCGTPYPLGLINKPNINNQGIDELPPLLVLSKTQPNTLQEHTKNKAIERLKNKETFFKKMIGMFRARILERNSSGLIAQLIRYVLHVFKLGDHIEVVFVKK